MQLANYLFFDGQCKAAFTFYEHCLRGKLDTLMPADKAPDRIIHAHLSIGDQVLMGSDWMADRPFEPPQGFSVSLGVDTLAEAERVFNALAEGGRVQMPLAPTFFSPGFGMLVDRFGIPWMVNCTKDN
jgi:PhnB protein